MQLLNLCEQFLQEISAFQVFDSCSGIISKGSKDDALDMSFEVVLQRSLQFALNAGI